MSKRVTILGIGLLMLLLGTAAVLGVWSREPSYGGRTLTSWLRQVADTPRDETQRFGEAQAAVRAIGAEKAVPVLLRLAMAKDGPFRSWLINKQARWNVSIFNLQEAVAIQQLGVVGFELLGTNCARAIPELTRRLDDTNHAFTAISCLSGIGKPAELVLCQSLTNRNPQVRGLAIPALAAVTDQGDEVIARVKGSLHDHDRMVRVAALRAVGGVIEAPDTSIPLLVAALEDRDEIVAASAAALLADFGTNGLRAFGALSNAVETGRPAVANRALRSLVILAPQEALPMVFNFLRSSDPLRRRTAVAGLRAYAVTTPEIRAALDSAAADPDPRVSRMAEDFIARLNRGGWPDEQSIPNEPGFGGRRFGATGARRGIGPPAGARAGGR